MITICMNMLIVQQGYLDHLSQISVTSGCKAAYKVTRLIEDGLLIARYYQQHNMVLLQELYLRRVFFDLLNKVCDPLLDSLVRQICLDQIYKPLLALKRFYRQYDASKSKFREIERELRILSNEFLPE